METDAPLTSAQLSRQIADHMLDKKAHDVVIMDVRRLTSITDYFVICTGDPDVQIRAIVEHLDESLRQVGERPHHIEGYHNLTWVLLDFLDVVVHIFLPETRDYYAFEQLWADAAIQQVRESPS